MIQASSYDSLPHPTPEIHSIAMSELSYRLQIDFTLLFTLFILLILSYLDRNVLSSAKVQGIEADLGMVGTNFLTP